MYDVEMHLYPGESRRIEAATRALDLLPVNAPVSAVFEAIRCCVPVAAGLFSIIRPGMDDALVSQPVDLPPEIFESWLRMPPNVLQMMLAPVLSSSDGRLWRDSLTLRGPQREQITVLDELDGAGLGEGAAYKLFERPIPWYGVEHFMLALLMERRKAIPDRSELLLAALHERIQAAILRIALPLAGREPIRALVMAEQALGYIYRSTTGRVIEVNRRAHFLMERARKATGILGIRGSVEAFAALAQEHCRVARPWQIGLEGPTASLHVDMHHLSKVTHSLSEDMTLIEMREIAPPPVVERIVPAFEALPLEQRRVAYILVRAPGGLKEIAAALGKPEGTVRKQIEHVYRRLGVHTRQELIVRFKQ